jgi:hypothetical protein
VCAPPPWATRIAPKIAAPKAPPAAAIRPTISGNQERARIERRIAVHGHMNDGTYSIPTNSTIVDRKNRAVEIEKMLEENRCSGVIGSAARR